MRILLLNPPHPAIGSRIPDEHLPPLGLLSIGGSLLDDGHEVRLLDAEFGPMSVVDIVDEVLLYAPDVLMVGHSGSSTAHPVVVEITRALRPLMSELRIIYGGVYPTYSWREILTDEPQIDFIVRGEGEEIARALVEALDSQKPLEQVRGIAYREEGRVTATYPAEVITDLDDIRIGWELVDLDRYSYWGDKKAVVVQFSRGCPHSCTYCGQRLFWKKWRHRDPVRFAAEIAELHREHGVEVFNFADENPTASSDAWKAFLEALIAEDVQVKLVGSTRADDIVRDADILHLYKKAGVERFLLGIENYDAGTLKMIQKGGSMNKDREAIRLLRENGILSMATYVVGFEEERDIDYLKGMLQLLSYDPDQIQLLYVTPHHWTAYNSKVLDRKVIQTDLSKWDYKHQVLGTRYMSPWRVLIWVKFIEVVLQARPKAVMRYLFHPDKSLREAMRWYYRMGRKVWPYEIMGFLFRDRRLKNGPTVAEFQNRLEPVSDMLRRVMVNG